MKLCTVKHFIKILKRKTTLQSVLPKWAEEFDLTFSLKSRQTHSYNQHLGAEARGSLWVCSCPGITVSFITAYRMRLCLPPLHTNGVGSLTVRYSDTFRKISVSYRNGIGKSTSREFILRSLLWWNGKATVSGDTLDRSYAFTSLSLKDRLPVSLHDKGRDQPIPMFNCRSEASDSPVHALGPNYTLLHSSFSWQCERSGLKADGCVHWIMLAPPLMKLSRKCWNPDLVDFLQGILWESRNI